MANGRRGPSAVRTAAIAVGLVAGVMGGLLIATVLVATPRVSGDSVARVAAPTQQSVTGPVPACAVLAALPAPPLQVTVPAGLAGVSGQYLEVPVETQPGVDPGPLTLFVVQGDSVVAVSREGFDIGSSWRDTGLALVGCAGGDASGDTGVAASSSPTPGGEGDAAPAPLPPGTYEVVVVLGPAEPVGTPSRFGPEGLSAVRVPLTVSAPQS